jgi:hypothetical protein
MAAAAYLMLNLQSVGQRMATQILSEHLKNLKCEERYASLKVKFKFSLNAVPQDSSSADKETFAIYGIRSSVDVLTRAL